MISMRWWLAITVATGACTNPPASSTDVNSYQEDLSRYRESVVEQYDVQDTLGDTDSSTTKVVASMRTPAEHDQTEEIQSLLDDIKEVNSQNRYVDGYTVQVYTGTDRIRASTAEREVERLFEINAEFSYERPNYKVKVGRFVNKLEAQKLYATLKAEFPGAIIIPQRIRVQ